ncbi:hypothetical protein [Micromonospora zhanjiangensis]|uniref:Uncharacterized protein n=1 Tax=Micromonospora zhanjiangensis TaxID=1522057 RepID=A0ABV8KF77_9ACTN
MGALVTLELAQDSPVAEQPWIITFGPLGGGDDWEPVVCGPYERAHALALAEAVVADEELMAVVEPLSTAVSIDEIRGEIAAAMAGAEEGRVELDDEDLYGVYEDTVVDEELDAAAGGGASAPPAEPPSEQEIRAGWRRIAGKLVGQAG